MKIVQIMFTKRMVFPTQAFVINRKLDVRHPAIWQVYFDAKVSLGYQVLLLVNFLPYYHIFIAKSLSKWNRETQPQTCYLCNNRKLKRCKF